MKLIKFLMLFFGLISIFHSYSTDLGEGPMEEVEPIENDVVDNFLEYELMRAINQRNVELLITLISQGADPNFIDIDGITPLILAIQNPPDLEIIAVLLHAGADPNIEDQEEDQEENELINYTNKLPLMWAIEESDGYDLYRQIIQLLIDRGANLNLQDSAGRTALMIAIHHSNIFATELLIKSGADLTIKDSSGSSIFDYAVEANFLNQLLKLLPDEFVINKKNEIENVCKAAEIANKKLDDFRKQTNKKRFKFKSKSKKYLEDTGDTRNNLVTLALEMNKIVSKMQNTKSKVMECFDIDDLMDFKLISKLIEESKTDTKALEVLWDYLKNPSIMKRLLNSYNILKSHVSHRTMEKVRAKIREDKKKNIKLPNSSLKLLQKREMGI